MRRHMHTGATSVAQGRTALPSLDISSRAAQSIPQYPHSRSPSLAPLLSSSLPPRRNLSSSTLYKCPLVSNASGSHSASTVFLSSPHCPSFSRRTISDSPADPSPASSAPRPTPPNETPNSSSTNPSPDTIRSKLKFKTRSKRMGSTIKQASGVLVTTRGSIAGHKIVEDVGIVVGSAVTSRHVGQDIWARVLGFFGAGIKSYAEMMVDSSAEATYNLMREASTRGATAVVRVRYETSTSTDPTVWSSTFSYTLAYGTAVKTIPDESIEDEGETPD